MFHAITTLCCKQAYVLYCVIWHQVETNSVRKYCSLCLNMACLECTYLRYPTLKEKVGSLTHFGYLSFIPSST